MWNHIRKNFQVKYGQRDSIISPKTFSFESSEKLLDLCLADRILYFWLVMEFIHKFIIEIHVLQCLFVRGSNKKQRTGRIISNFKKGQTFRLLWQISALGDNLTMWLAFSHPPPPPKKGLPLPFTLTKKITYLDTQLKGDLTDLFWKLRGYSLFHQTE